MLDSPRNVVLGHIRGMAVAQRIKESSDAELLAAFVESRDQVAFAEMVRRHGPLVLRVCRRVLGHLQDAEDAYQATFLLLARNGGSIRKKDCVAEWLHGVACRVAQNARRGTARRRRHEEKVGAGRPSEPPWEAGWREVQSLLHEEIARLPKAIREVFVLCCLEERSGAEAARQLGVKEGTVSSRLTKARQLLRRRLVRRGVDLSTVLAALALWEGQASASLCLASRTVRSVIVAVTNNPAACGDISAGAAALADGVNAAMIRPQGKVLTILLLAAGLSAGIVGLGLAARPPATAREAPTLAAVVQAKAGEPGRDARTRPKEEAGEVMVSGRVLGLDDKPLANARLFLAPWGDKKEDLKVLATTDDDGRFRAAVSAAAVRTGAKLVAIAKDHGPNWLWLGQKTAASEFTLRLVKDDVPITGRVLDLEGRPIAGASVGVLFIQEVDLKPWLTNPKHSDLAWTGKRFLPTDLDGPTSVKTDKEGRFRLTGFGHDRVAHLQIRGVGIEDNDVEIITRTGKVDGLRLESRTVYPLDHAFTVRPSKPIVGTVRDKKTGKPIAGIEIVFPNATWTWARATTDEKGRYRLDGVGKQKEYPYITAGGLPYFTAAKREIADTPGLDPLVVDFELDRGIVVKGRLTDAVTAQPVSGQIRYEPAGDNPNLKDFPERPRSSGHTREDGSFTVLTVPGAGQLAAVADDADAYALAKEDGFRQSNAAVRVNVSEMGEKSLVCDIALQPAHSLGGSVTGPDGKPVGEAHSAGLHTVRPFLRGAKKLSDESFRVHGLTSKDERVLVFVHPEKKLAKVQKVAAEDKEPLTIRLEPMGTLAGRVLDSAGRPWAGVKVKAAYRIAELEEARNAGKDYKDLPWELLYDYAKWDKLINREATTDTDGKFRLKGLVPGLKYDLGVNDGAPQDVIRRESLAVESGKAKDLGDLK